MKPQNIVITGANSGLGFESAKELYEEGHNIVFGSRSVAKNEEAIKTITQKQGGSIKSFPLDLSSKKSVEEFSKSVQQCFPDRIDILMNNAGLILTEQKVNEDGIQMILAINHFGHFYLTYLLWDLVVKAPEARVINVSSLLHYDAPKDELEDIKCEKKKFDGLAQYNISKLFNVFFTVGLNNLIQQKKLNNVKTACLHPGIVETGFQDNLKDDCFFKIFRCCCCCLFVDSSSGSRTQLHLSQCPFTEIKSGEYYNDDTKLKEMDKRGRDMDKVNRLWKMSEENYKIKFN